jgi:predicted AAA+ superfamily ATPase
VDTYLLKGGYPEIWAEQLKPQKWLESYIQTYIQRDVRQLRNISDLAAFMRLVQLCAHHAGQLLNREELAKQTGVDSKTVLSWLGLLESSYILFQLQPWHNNLNKRIIKSPKLYFYDTGLLCTLLRISSKQGLKQHPMYGAIFENWCVAELCKNRLNRGERDGLYFFRDSTGNEIDVIMEKETGPLAIEIKSSSKDDLPHTGGLRYWRKYQPGRQGILLYQGASRETDHPDLGLLSWTDIGEI